MGQGQAISLLSRAFYHSKGNDLYLNTAFAALKPFKVLSKDGGVLSKFMNLYPWYEEYPTIPPIFILNGFMYSLIGLYDLFTLAPKESQVNKTIFLIHHFKINHNLFYKYFRFRKNLIHCGNKA